MAYDVEDFCDDLETTINANLNTKIAALNTEKNDTVTLATIDSGAYFFQTMDGKQANYDPFIWYGIADFDATDFGSFGYSVQNPSIDVIIVVADEGEDVNIARRLLRYQRALREVLEENFYNQSRRKFSIINKLPVDLALLNDSFTHKAIGVTIKAEMG